MTNLIELLEEARTTLQETHRMYGFHPVTLINRLDAAIAELKEAKPVAFIGPEGQLVAFNATRSRDVYWTPLYAHPPVAPVEQQIPVKETEPPEPDPKDELAWYKWSHAVCGIRNRYLAEQNFWYWKRYGVPPETRPRVDDPAVSDDARDAARWRWISEPYNWKRLGSVLSQQHLANIADAAMQGKGEA